MLKESSNNNNKNIFSETTVLQKKRWFAKTDSVHYQIKMISQNKIQMIWIFLILF